MAYMRLGDLLIAAGAITDEQLQAALQAQKTSGQRLGDLLIDSGVITQHQLIDALQMQLGVDYIDLTRVSIPVELAKYVPRAIAKKYCVVPVKLVKDELYVAMSDPLDFIAQEELKAASRKQIIPMISTRRATEQAIATLYGNEGTARVIEEMKRQAGDTDGDIVPAQLVSGPDDAEAAPPSASSTPSSSVPSASAPATSTSSPSRAKWWFVCVSTVCSTRCSPSPPTCKAPSSPV